MSILARLLDTLTRWLARVGDGDRFDLAEPARAVATRAQAEAVAAPYGHRVGGCHHCDRPILAPLDAHGDIDTALLWAACTDHALADHAAHAAYLKEMT
ncbi:MAG: hypothetical protein ACRDMV_04890 [Streptosporangiales bacterium]